MALINTAIKPFKATAFKDGEFVDVSSEDIKGKWAVFVFYPADFTFVCPTELGDIADKYEELQSRGVEVFSVSTDTHFTHKAWHDSSDTITKIKFEMIGVIQAMEITSEGIGRDADDLVRKVKAAQYVANNPGEVCPAKWKEGEATLAPSLDLVGKI
jgi:alkyl hydroperoxide reductase subunit AhpC